MNNLIIDGREYPIEEIDHEVLRVHGVDAIHAMTEIVSRGQPVSVSKNGYGAEKFFEKVLVTTDSYIDVTSLTLRVHRDGTRL